MLIGFCGDWDDCVEMAQTGEVTAQMREGCPLVYVTSDDLHVIRPSFLSKQTFIVLDAWLIPSKDMEALMAYSKLDVIFVFGENKVPSTYKGKRVEVAPKGVDATKFILRGKWREVKDCKTPLFSLVLEILRNTDNPKQRNECLKVLRYIMDKRIFDYDRSYALSRICSELSDSAFKHNAWWD